MSSNLSISSPKVLIGLTLLVVLTALGFWYTQRPAGEDGEITQGDINAAINELIATGATSTRGNGFTVEREEVPGGSTVHVPSLTRPVPPTPDLDDAARAIVVGKIDAAISELKKDASNYGKWIELGGLRLMVKDYKGAEEAWVYATVLGPNTTIPYGNLGDLYANYTREYEKAEVAFRKAITNDLRSATYYRSLYELYLNYKPTPDAPEKILKEAVAKFPNNLDYYVLLARYYRDEGRSQDARAAYDQAITIAKKLNNTEASTQLTTEKSQVK